MGSGASTINNDTVPEVMNLEEAQKWAYDYLEVKEEDWPEEKWLELSGEKGTVKKEDILKLCNDLSLPTLTNPTEVNGEVPDAEEEVFAVDGEVEGAGNDDMAQGTFNEDVDDGLDLGGMIMPDLAVVGSTGGTNNDKQKINAEESEVSGAGEEIFAVDGEAFESASGPGCFDDSENTGVGGNSVSGLEVTGSPVKS